MLRLGLPQFVHRLAPVLVSLSLLSYMGYVLTDLYRSRNELQSFQQEQMLRESTRRAQALEYFFSERLKDMRELAQDRDLESYFENRALGMSMHYGLAASLYALGGSFDAFRGKGRLGEAGIYQRIAFVDAAGSTLVDVHPLADAGRLVDVGSLVAAAGAATVADHAAWAPLLARRDGDPSLGVLDCELVLTVPYRFKSELGGHILAWLSAREIYLHFVGMDDPAKRMAMLFHGSELLFAPAAPRGLLPREALPPIEAIRRAGKLRFSARGPGGGSRDLLAVLTPIAGTPLSLVTVLPADDVHHVSPAVLIAVVGAVGLLIVLGGLASVLRHRRTLRAMERLFQTVPFAIVVVARDRTILLANETAGALLSSGAGELAGQSWEAFAGAPSAGAPCRSAREVVIRDARGKPRPVLLAEIPGSLGNRDFFLEAFVDLSERKLLEAQLRHAQKLEAVGQLAAGIAHEINTPAQFVGDSLQFLNDGFAGLWEVLARYRRGVTCLAAAPEHQALLEEIRDAEEAADVEYLEENAPAAFSRALEGMGRISSIVRAMKEFAHPDQREKSAADLNRALQNTLTIARNEYKHVAEIEEEYAELPLVPCHLGDINQVFLNLLVNAAHAIEDVVGRSGARGRIRVRTARQGEDVLIEIADSGCGIPEAIRDRIYDPFFTTKQVGRGSGQGLAIARSVVVDKHGGSLTFSSAVGQGTTFTVRLPLESAARPSPAGASARSG